MSTRDVDDRVTVVAPQERSPQAERYLRMLRSTDAVISASNRWNVDQLLDLAQTHIGGVSLGGDSALQIQGLKCLAEPIQHASCYDDLGRWFANCYIYNLISKYLQFERDLAAFPEIYSVPVSNPMFIVGFGRTGSTFLHHLLALDPNARAPQLWELTEPSPPPRRETYESDPRIKRMRMQLASRAIFMPDFDKIHESGVQLPEECNQMVRHGEHHIFRGIKSKEYSQWLRNLQLPELQALYQHYKLQVQHLQLFYRKGYWVSKCLSHSHFFPVLFKVFPDARVIRLHRDPRQIIAAFASIGAHLQVVYTKRVDFRELGQHALEYFLESMHKSMAIDKEVSDEHFIDVLFEDLTGNPIGTLREIYSKFGCDFTPQFEKRVREFLQTDSGARKYKHVYTLEQFGLSSGEILARSQEYLAWVERRTGTKLCKA